MKSYIQFGMDLLSFSDRPSITLLCSIPYAPTINFGAGGGRGKNPDI